MKISLHVVVKAALVVSVAGLAGTVYASSHGEAPFVKEVPKVDATDFYMFNSYEAGKEGMVTIVANYYPLQDPYGGPNFFTLDPDAVYQIKIDNNGDAVEDLTFSFNVQNTNRDISLMIGNASVPVPLVNVGMIGPTPSDNAALNVLETYNCALNFGPANRPPAFFLADAGTGATTFRKPVDNIGTKSIPLYEPYARGHIYTINLPGPGNFQGRMFVGQRKDPFVVNLSGVFDLVNLNPVGPEDTETDDLADKNVTSFILELPAAFLRNRNGEPVIGGWTTALLPRIRTLKTAPTFSRPTTEAGDFVQVSRLGMPLVNEVVIGLRDKNRFNASQPIGDTQFLTYVTNPTLPALLQVLFGVTPPTLPRNDLVAVFLTGVPGLNQPANVRPSEMLRLNTNTDPMAGGIPPVPAAMQSRLGVIGGDLAGFPNGRRPGDDIVDIELRVVMGRLYPDAGVPGGNAPAGLLPLTDGATHNAGNYDEVFPYLRMPLPGSGN